MQNINNRLEIYNSKKWNCEKLMSNKIILLIFITNIIFLTITPTSSSTNNSTWWDEDWSFRQEICIPISTDNKLARSQPIDMRVVFDHACWVKNENEHSLRVVFQKDEIIRELESQIYNLNYSDENHVKSCSLVFLIPEDANGEEKYYLYYDKEKKPNPNYPDHVQVDEDFYCYEPIPGYPFESRFYKLTEDGDTVYGAAYEGEFLGFSTAQQITKFKPETKEVTSPKNAEAWASFDYFYRYGSEVEEFSSTIQCFISKNIFVDGNLMVEFCIVSGTPFNDFQTTGTYRYYYCPTEDKRIYANIKHEALKETHVATGSDSNGNIAGLQVGLMQSPSIEELNFGKIFPYMHVYSEDEIIQEYTLDTDPEYTPEGIRILTTNDDVDLGNKAWASFDFGESGMAHSIILDSNNVITSGTDERKEVQIQAIEGSTPGLLGLETDLITFYYSRNAYERGSTYDWDIPADFVAEYDAEFFSTISGGYKTVDQEAEIFQSLIKVRPGSRKKITDEEQDEKDMYSLTVFPHLAPSAPMGTLLSLLTGKNISYISAELYQDGKLISTGIGERLSMRSLPSFSDTKLLEKIKLAIGIFDWGNLTFFKKIRFQNLVPARYLVKIYKENPVIGEERKYLGFKIIEVDENTSTHLFCRPQGRITVTVLDQYEQGVENVQAKLIQENMTISEEITSENGIADIKAPCNLKKSYTLRLLYKGFIIYEEPINLRYIRNLIPIKKSLDIELYDIKLNFKDTWGLTPNYKLNPILKNKDIDNPILPTAEHNTDKYYLFTNLPPGKYQLELKYKSFLLEEDINIPSNNEEITFVFPAEFKIKTHVFNARGLPINDREIVISRGDKKANIDSNEKGFSQLMLPPGIYNVKVYHQDDLIGQRKINVIGERTFELVTIEEPVFPFIVTCAAGVFFLLGAFLALRKKEIVFFLKILAVTLAIISIVSPWWMIHGSSSDPVLETSTKLYIFPSELITITTTSNVIAGERGLEFLPDVLTNAILLFSLAIILSCVLIILNTIFKRLNKKKLMFLSYIFGISLLISCLLIFYFGVSALTKLGVGTFFGSGYLNVTIPGEGIRIPTHCNWGPDIGFYLCLISVIILLSISASSIKKAFSRGFLRMYK